MESQFTEEARIAWSSISSQQQHLLHDLKCPHCKSQTHITPTEGLVDNGYLLLNGPCQSCGTNITRVLNWPSS